MNKLLVVLLGGPDEPCRLQHAILFAQDVAARGGKAQIVLEGKAPAWLPGFADQSNPLTKLFSKALEQALISGVCKGCANMHSALDAAASLKLSLLDGAYGHASLDRFIIDDYTIVSL